MYKSINGAKIASKRLKTTFDLTASQSQELLARALGYRDWHHITEAIGTSNALTRDSYLQWEDILSYARSEGIARNLAHDIFWKVLDLDLAHSEQDRAQDIAYLAQDALQEARHQDFALLIERALEVDPLCPHALFMTATFIPKIRDRIPLYKDALRGALRTVPAAKTDTVNRLISHENSFHRPRSSSGTKNVEENPFTFLSDAHFPYDRDQWGIMDRRDLIRGWFFLGEAYLRNGQPDVAAAALIELAYLSYSNRFDSIVWLCSALLADDRLLEAREALSPFRYGTPEEPWPLLVLSLCDMAEGNEPKNLPAARLWKRFQVQLIQLVEETHHPGPDAGSKELPLFEYARALSHAIMLNPKLRTAFEANVAKNAQK